MQKLSVSRQIALMLAVPLSVLLVAALNNTLQRAREVSEMDDVKELASLTVAASDLLRETQRERGLSSGFLASKGERFGPDLITQRSRTDGVLTKFRELAGTMSERFHEAELSRQLSMALARLEGLAARREAVSARLVSPDDTVNWYTELNALIIGTIPFAAQITGDGQVVNRLVAVRALLQMREAMGIERAALSGAFAEDRFAGGLYERLLAAMADQEAHRVTFDAFAPQELRALYRERMAGQYVDEVARLERIAMQRAQSGGFGVDPVRWFHTVTVKIDRLSEIDASLVNDLRATVDARKSEARRSLVTLAVGTLGAFVAAALLGLLLGRNITGRLNGSVRAAQEIAAQIVAAVHQQSSTATETASAISETTATVEEIRQTSEMTANKARAVADLAARSATGSAEARQVVEQGIDAMRRIRTEVESIARNILELSEQNIQIGEIVQSVNAIAQQSNLLAVNASIEAAKAGEYGRGFAVVAAEVKALAGQSKEATDQIRTILSDVQRSSNTAVMVTEQGAKCVEEGTRLIEELGRSINALVTVIGDSSDAASQISLASTQQLAGVRQISEAMRNIELATRENASGARILEHVASQVRSVSDQLNMLVAGRAAA